MSDISFSQGLYELIDCYDGFIIDQWGVLHNGVEVHDGAIDVLHYLRKNHKQVILLSNTPKRAEDNINKMKKIGLKSTLYNEVVTSGEVTWRGIKEQNKPPFENLGSKCYLISRSDDKDLLEGLDVEVVSDIEDAEFILITSFDPKVTSMEDLDIVLKKAVGKRIPLICANPDMVTITGHERGVGPGAVAQRYQELGGSAHYIGKPHKTIFRYALSLFKDVIPSRVLMIGDSMQHDVAGGIAVDLDTLFITSGIHSSNFKPDMSKDQKRKVMDQIMKNYGGIHPKFVMESLIWQTPESILRDRDRARMQD